jgi:hypothetical protein
LRNRLAEDRCQGESMKGRFLAAVLLAVLLPVAAQARDCIAERQGEVAIVEDAGCGELRLLSRQREEPPTLEIGATWIEFVQPGGPGEWRYNDWIHKQIAGINFDKPIRSASDKRREDRFTVRSFYRSDRLISARYERHVCCGGTGGDTIYGSLNVDLERWTLLSPDDLVSLGAAANVCWQQFGDDKKGAAFAEAYPLEHPWVDRDFEVRRVGHFMRDIIGPVVVNPVVSKERTRSLFVAVLQDQSRWSFREQGALVDFGELLGSAKGAFTCGFANADLRAIAHAGVAVPP